NNSMGLFSYTAPEEGKVYIMYHGTSIQAALNISTEGFQQSADGMLERGVYLSRDLKKAARYPLHLPEYDTAWCPPKCGMVSSGLEEDCVWDPKRITDIDLISPVLCLKKKELPLGVKKKKLNSKGNKIIIFIPLVYIFLASGNIVTNFPSL
uniref:Grass carp reovirus (GCRV)-induced gene 2g n=1 Tax=Cyprinus carpio TaxID=7962 RepID=A0A8C1J7M6_CYPCA